MYFGLLEHSRENGSVNNAGSNRNFRVLELSFYHRLSLLEWKWMKLRRLTVARLRVE
ncbi:hypothetical protein GIB67_009321 [Kingdonia uniflora]|uniref:Uncharacterized protein n=1 Tax=Kingdonia uniflora TaxID=39325 RepID=A0A7J7N335_9MAGN|nr:hypothetical protein GIB67_009321 [Kingdonia uniflora]